MGEQSDPLRSLLTRVEARQGPQAEHLIADEINRLAGELGDAGGVPADLEAAIRAEAMAFSFMEDHNHPPSGWGTYYGPKAVFANDHGDMTEIPSIQLVTADTLEYWEKRVRECVHPLMRSRYADLVWDFSKKVDGNGPSVDMAHIVIDSTIEIAKHGLVKHEVALIQKLRRALGLALSISDKTRIKSVVEAMIHYEDSVADDHLPGLWGFSFDALVDQKKISLSQKQEEKIIQDLEARLTRVSNPAEDGAFDPFSAEPAARRLAKYYRRREKQADVKRVLSAYGDAFLHVGESASALTASAWLKKVFETYSDFGMKNEADEIAHRLREVAAHVEEEMVAVSTKTNISQGDLERYLESMVEGELDQVLMRIVGQFLPNRDKAVKEVQNLAKEAPVQSLVTHTIQDHDGRVVAQVGPLDDDPEGRVLLYIAEQMGFKALFLELVLDRMRSKFSPRAEDLLAYLLQSPLFEESRSRILTRGVGGYLQGDFLVAACVLLPEIEAAVRRLLTLKGGSIYRKSSNGGLRLRPLDQMLRDPAVTETLGEDGTTYLRVLLTDARGWNLRNNVCHGFLPPETFDSTEANRILHAMLLLALVRPVQASRTPGAEEKTSEGDEDSVTEI